LARSGATDAINGSQRDLGMLMIWNVYSSDTGHTLFIPEKCCNKDFSKAFKCRFSLDAACAWDLCK
jgi:hypothetical protein